MVSKRASKSAGSRFVLAFAVISGLLGGSVASYAAAGTVTSTFGMRRDPLNGSVRMHAGTDMAAPRGHYVYATGDGIVQRARWVGGYGLMVEMAHGYGFQSRFGHLSGIYVREGQMIRRGQIIGQVGSTGRSTGPHLHYEVRINGRPVDSRRYMQIVFATPPSPASLAMTESPRSAAYQGGSARVQLMAPGTNSKRKRGSISMGAFVNEQQPQIEYPEAESGFSRVTRQGD